MVLNLLCFLSPQNFKSIWNNTQSIKAIIFISQHLGGRSCWSLQVPLFLSILATDCWVPALLLSGRSSWGSYTQRHFGHFQSFSFQRQVEPAHGLPSKHQSDKVMKLLRQIQLPWKKNSQDSPRIPGAIIQRADALQILWLLQNPYILKWLISSLRIVIESESLHISVTARHCSVI